MFARAPATVLRSSSGRAASTQRRNGCSGVGTSVVTRSANGVSTPARSRLVQSPAMYASPKPIFASSPSRWKNVAGRTSRMTGEPGPPAPTTSPSGNTARSPSPATVRRNSRSASHALTGARSGVSRPGQRAVLFGPLLDACSSRAVDNVMAVLLGSGCSCGVFGTPDRVDCRSLSVVVG
jgi:hypothetical protein